MWSPQNPSNPPPPPYLCFAPKPWPPSFIVSSRDTKSKRLKGIRETPHVQSSLRLEVFIYKGLPCNCFISSLLIELLATSKINSSAAWVWFSPLNLWLVWKKKTRPNLSTDKMQNQNQSWLDRTRFPALESVSVFLKSPHWLLVFTMGFRSQQSIAMRHNGPVIKYVQGLLAFKRSGCFTP